MSRFLAIPEGAAAKPDGKAALPPPLQGLFSKTPQTVGCTHG
jgi:hypothetical protein